MTRSRIVNLRLRNQRLVNSSFHKPTDVLKWLGAVQAQDFYGAKWALGLRLRDATDELIEKAFSDGEIIRTHVMRPTWHFVAASDIRWLLKLTAPRVNMTARNYYRKFELDDGVFKRINRALERALRGGRQLTRQEVRTAINKAGIPCDDLLRFTFILLRAELDALICSGARRGKQFTYALFDERVPDTKTLSKDEALAELARRYFTSRGPATLRDFVWWSGLSTTDARTGLALIQGSLSKERIDSEDYWFSPSSSSVAPVRNIAHLLPSFDEYFVAYKDRRAAIDPESNQSASQSSAVLNSPVIVDGMCVGHWKRNVVKGDIAIDLSLVSAIKKSDKPALASAIERHKRFFRSSHL